MPVEINLKPLLTHSHRSASGALSQKISQPLRPYIATQGYDYWIKYDGVQKEWIESLTTRLVLNRGSGAYTQILAPVSEIVVPYSKAIFFVARNHSLTRSKTLGVVDCG